MLPRDREDSSLLKMARTLLTRQAESLGVGRERMPQPPRAPPPLAAAISAQGVAFDPYKVRRVGGDFVDCQYRVM